MHLASTSKVHMHYVVLNWRRERLPRILLSWSNIHRMFVLSQCQRCPVTIANSYNYSIVVIIQQRDPCFASAW